MPRVNDTALYPETSTLRQELCAALKEDESRKRTDEMKKRAIHTAASYDEFRHMVSCAQLTPVTRKEMEMLSDQKRGWQGRSGGIVPPTAKTGSNGRRQASSRRTRTCGASATDGSAKKGPLRVPENYLQFHRVWRRRCQTNDEQLSYLRLIGPTRLASLFRVEMEPGVMSRILSLLCDGFLHRLESNHHPEHLKLPSGSTEDTPGAGQSTSGEGGGDVDLMMASPVEVVKRCVGWLSALTKTGGFGINTQFLAAEEKRSLARLFDLLAATLGESGLDDVDMVCSLRKAYTV